MFTNQTDNGTWTESDSMKYLAFLKRVHLAEKILLCFITIFTILGNSLVLVATWREKSLHQPSKYFIVCLAIADLLVGTFVSPLKLNQRMIENESESTVSIHLCRFLTWIDTLGLTASIFTLVFISIDRYLKISKPLQYNSRMTTSKSVKIIFIIWLISFAIATFAATPYSGSHGIIVMNSNLFCYPVDEAREIGFYSFLATVFFLSTVVILVMYARIFAAAHKRQKMMRNGELGQSSNVRNQRSVFLQDLKVVRMSLFVVGMFVLCWFPFVIYNLLEIYDPGFVNWESTSLSYLYSITISVMVVDLLPLLNSLCNPIIYACLDQKYKAAFKNLLQRMMRQQNSGNRQPPIGIELHPSIT